MAPAAENDGCELHGSVAVMCRERTVVLRGQQAPGVVTKEVGKRRRRSPADAAPRGDSQLASSYGICPDFENCIFEAHSNSSSDFLRAIGN